jgi:hypothetical protein
VADFRHFDTETILEPLRDQVTMAECLSCVAIRRSFPAKHHRMVANRDEPIEDLGRVEEFQYFIV